MAESPTIEHIDVLIIGAGLSGIGMGCHLRRKCPDREFLLLESRDTLGGTWDLFRYPGIRSDSDMYTLGYSFKAWTGLDTIAAGGDILDYLKETAEEYRITERIRYRHRVIAADWWGEDAQWHVQVRRDNDSTTRTLSCNFLVICGGYYKYEEGHTPTFPEQETFQGQVVHAQHWPQDLDYRNKRVVVIGSGATAVTLIPELARHAASTIMLQRSPTYVATLPGRDGLAKMLRKFLPENWVYRLTRWKRVLGQILVYRLSRRHPGFLKKLLLGAAREQLGPDYDVDTHFTPRYNPWDQRLCAVPDGDLFEVLREGDAEVVTDQIENFTGQGIALASGRELAADIIVLATGLNLQFGGGVVLSREGEEIAVNESMVYRGAMLSNVPNMATIFGYTNASWTLKADITADYVCRILNHMKQSGTTEVIAPLDRPVDLSDPPMMDFSANYVRRSSDELPRQGQKTPWRVYQNYIRDWFSLRYSSLTGGGLKFR